MNSLAYTAHNDTIHTYNGKNVSLKWGLMSALSAACRMAESDALMTTVRVSLTLI